MNQAQNTPEDVVYGAISKVTGKTREQISPEDKFEELVEDSIQLFELVLQLEEILPGPVDYEKLISVETVADAVEFVRANYHKA